MDLALTIHLFCDLDPYEISKCFDKTCEICLAVSIMIFGNLIMILGILNVFFFLNGHSVLQIYEAALFDIVKK